MKNDQDPLVVIKPKTPQYAIWLAEDAAIYTRYARPNIARRFFLWLFFGWQFVAVKKVACEQCGVDLPTAQPGDRFCSFDCANAWGKANA